MNLGSRQFELSIVFELALWLLLDFCANGLGLRVRWILNCATLAPELVPGRAIGPSMLSNPSHDVSRGRVLDVQRQVSPDCKVERWS